MSAARIQRSKRLQRVHALLLDGVERSTVEIVQAADVCAVNSCIHELRENGAIIECHQIRSQSGQRLWLYKMLAPCPMYSPRQRAAA